MQPDQNPEPQQQPAPEAPQPAPVSPALGSQPAPDQPPITPSGKKKLPSWAKILLIAFGSVIALIGLAILGFFIYANSLIAAPMKVSDQFMDALQKNDASTAYNLTSSEFKLRTNEDRLETLFNQIKPELQGEEKLSDKHYLVNNGVSTATLIYSVPSGDDTVYLRIRVREKNDKWEVLEMFASKTELKADNN